MNPNPNQVSRENPTKTTEKSTVDEYTIKRGDIYVWDGAGRKYRLRKGSSVVIEVRAKEGVMVKYHGLYATVTTTAEVVRISMDRNSVDIHVSNDEQVVDDRITLSSYGNGKVDEITQGFVDAVMVRFNIFIRMNLPYIEEKCGGYDACVEIEEAKNKELGIRILTTEHVKTKYI